MATVGYAQASAARVRNTVLNAFRFHSAKSKSGMCTAILRTQARNISAQASSAYNKIWHSVWGDIPEKIFSCVDGIPVECQSINTSFKLSDMRALMDDLNGTLNSALEGCRNTKQVKNWRALAKRILSNFTATQSSLSVAGLSCK